MYTLMWFLGALGISSSCILMLTTNKLQWRALGWGCTAVVSVFGGCHFTYDVLKMRSKMITLHKEIYGERYDEQRFKNQESKDGKIEFPSTPSISASRFLRKVAGTDTGLTQTKGRGSDRKSDFHSHTSSLGSTNSATEAFHRITTLGGKVSRGHRSRSSSTKSSHGRRASTPQLDSNTLKRYKKPADQIKIFRRGSLQLNSRRPANGSRSLSRSHRKSALPKTGTKECVRTLGAPIGNEFDGSHRDRTDKCSLKLHSSRKNSTLGLDYSPQGIIAHSVESKSRGESSDEGQLTYATYSKSNAVGYKRNHSPCNLASTHSESKETHNQQHISKKGRGSEGSFPRNKNDRSTSKDLCASPLSQASAQANSGLSLQLQGESQARGGVRQSMENLNALRALNEARIKEDVREAKQTTNRLAKLAVLALLQSLVVSVVCLVPLFANEINKEDMGTHEFYSQNCKKARLLVGFWTGIPVQMFFLYFAWERLTWDSFFRGVLRCFGLEHQKKDSSRKGKVALPPAIA
mmetsp:Transcript_16792/g.23522  ORF Transcript_16792/g.23522 Transcript_16792/m.23522 type:complete len:521 (+) Transcript_16792:288-1850(+)